MITKQCSKIEGYITCDTSKMKLITGATGRIGIALVRELNTRGEKVKVLVREGSNTKDLESFNCEYVYGDILDVSKWESSLDGVDTIFHLAAHINISTKKKDFTLDTNIQGTKNIADICLSRDIVMVYTSSIHALAAPSDGSLITEETPFVTDSKEKRGIYDYSKSYATKYVLEQVNKGLRAIIVHPTGVVGPYDFRPSLFGQGMIDLVKSGLKLTTGGKFDYVDVRDVVWGMLKALELERYGGRYILSGEQLSMEEYIKYLKEFTGIQSDTKILGYVGSLLLAYISSILNRDSQITPYGVKTLYSNSNISHEKATKELGYISRSVKESLYDQYTWFKLNGYLDEKK